MDHRKKICLLFMALYPLLLPAKPRAEYSIWPFKINRFDKSGQMHGRWKLYQPDGKSLLRNGRYKHGQESGKWRYYYQDGKIRKIEYHKLNADQFLVQIFYDNGQLEKQGMAKVVETEKIIHYYWLGAWQVYDRQGKPSHIEYYEKGNEMRLQLAAE